MTLVRLIRACAVPAVVGSSLACGAICAQSADGAMSDRVRIELRGQVVPQCSFHELATALDLTLADGGAAAQRQLTFRVSCNAPFTYSLSSARGGMRHEAASESAADPLTQFPYSAALTIPTDDGGTMSVSCSSDDLGKPSGACAGRSGDRTAIEKDASLTVSWGAVGRRLAAGRYTDDLRIVFGIEN
jgi:hypothetical protein